MDNLNVTPLGFGAIILSLIGFVLRLAGPIALRLASNIGQKIITDAISAATKAATNTAGEAVRGEVDSVREQLEAELKRQRDASMGTFEMFMEASKRADLRHEQQIADMETVHRAQVGGLTDSLSAMQARVTSLEAKAAKVDALQVQVNTLTADKDERESTITTLRDDLKERDRRIAQLEEQYGWAREDIATLRDYIRAKMGKGTDELPVLKTDGTAKTTTAEHPKTEGE